MSNGIVWGPTNVYNIDIRTRARSRYSQIVSSHCCARVGGSDVACIHTRAHTRTHSRVRTTVQRAVCESLCTVCTCTRGGCSANSIVVIIPTALQPPDFCSDEATFYYFEFIFHSDAFYTNVIFHSVDRKPPAGSRDEMMTE